MSGAASAPWSMKDAVKEISRESNLCLSASPCLSLSLPEDHRLHFCRICYGCVPRQTSVVYSKLKTRVSFRKQSTISRQHSASIRVLVSTSVGVPLHSCHGNRGSMGWGTWPPGRVDSSEWTGQGGAGGWGKPFPSLWQPVCSWVGTAGPGGRRCGTRNLISRMNGKGEVRVVEVRRLLWLWQQWQLGILCD